MTKSLRALIVDDSEDDTLLIARELRRAGYDLNYNRVDSPGTMKEALNEQKWDVILVDYKMPHFTGIDALKIAKDYTPETPFILVSGVIVEEMAVEAMRRGANDCIKKDSIERLTPTIVRELQAAQERRERRIAEMLLASKNEELSNANKELIELNSELETTNKELAETNMKLESANRMLTDSRTEIIEINAKLTESRRKLSTLIENLPGIVYRCRNDKEWTMEFISNGCSEITGYTSEELIENAVLSFNDIIHEQDREMVWSFIQSAVVHSTPYTLRYRIISKEGRIIWVWEKGRGIFNNKGELVALEGFINDITDVVRKDEQIRQIQKVEIIGTLAGGIAHDFNNILSGIIGGAELLGNLLEKENLNNTGGITKYLNTIKNASSRSSELIKKLLILSRKQETKLAPVDLNKSMSNVADICSSSFPKSIEIKAIPYFRPAIVTADPTHIEQVILNLCVNASHAMTIMRDPGEKEGGILSINIEKIKADRLFHDSHSEAKEGCSYYVITVTDTGVGIDDYAIGTLFEPFVSTKKDGAGSGLGLTIVNSIIKQYDGFIDVKSAKGEGSSFLAYLPLINDEICIDSEDSEAQIDKLPSASGRIFVVDDEEIMITIIEGALKENGYSVISTTDSKAAVDIYREQWKDIDIVILDIVMPMMSGKDIFIEMKKINPLIKIILTSGSASDTRVSEILSMGALDFLPKPVDINLMRKKVRDIAVQK